MSKLYESEYKITSPFGPRNLYGDTRSHKGIDCVGITSKNVLAVCDATVVSSQIILDKTNATWEWGNYIKFDDGYGYFPHYCHLSKRLVFKGDKVKLGQVIGVEGQTGYSFGSHLHFEVRNAQGISIDPQVYFKILEEREKKMEVKTVDEALKVLHEKGVMNTTEYWKNAANVVKYLDSLLINMANKIK